MMNKITDLVYNRDSATTRVAYLRRALEDLEKNLGPGFGVDIRVRINDTGTTIRIRRAYMEQAIRMQLAGEEGELNKIEEKLKRAEEALDDDE